MLPVIGGCETVLGPLSSPPTFASAEQFNVQNSVASTVIVHRNVKLRGNVETMGSCLLFRDSLFRGDVAKISLQNCVVVEENVLVKPPLRCVMGRPADACSVSIGTFSLIGKRVVSEAVSIGAFVVIESDCCLGALVVVGHGAWLKKGCVVPPHTVLEPFYIYEGNPARPTQRLCEDSHPLEVKELIVQYFQSVVIG